MSPLLIIGALAVVAIIPIVYFTFLADDTPKMTAAELLGSGAAASLDLNAVNLNRPLLERMNPLVEKLKKRTPKGWTDQIEARIQMAGLASTWTVEKVLIVKVIGGGLGGLISFYFYNKGFKPSPMDVNFLGMIAAFPLGFMYIDLNLKSKAQKRAQMIQLALPDILDQITIGVEAGLGFDAAMARSAKSNDGPLAVELTRTLQHVQAGLSRAEALRGLAQRNKVPELRQFVGAILQAEQFGIPMAQVLRVQAAEQRRKRRQRAEEKAMKLPVKVLFPLVLCILPALFVVLIGPAAIRIATNKFS
jgi:tight adherence protein C